MELSERKKQILRAVVENYIQTAEPVGSKAIVASAGLKVSSATIRNEMAELENLGYLEQPHTSAGRIPSPKGYRLYVNELMEEHRLTMQEAEKVLGKGMSLVVFPEGARTWDGKMKRFKRGAFLLADEFNMPVVPITIRGAFEVMPRWRYLPLPGTITLTIHGVIEPDATTGKHALAPLMDRCHSEIESAL